MEPLYFLINTHSSRPPTRFTFAFLPLPQVKGNISNQTLLPMPITIDKVFDVESQLALG